MLTSDFQKLFVVGMKMKTKRSRKSVWLFDGNPDSADLMVEAATLSEGGYVLVIELTNGLTRIAATRHPAKYVTAWHQFVKRYGLPKIARMIVSQPHLRYEAIKRSIAKAIEEHRDEELDAYRTSVKTVTDMAEVVIETLANR
jgi:predicted component of type VI protein secretion system